MRAREIILENKLAWRIRSSQFKDLDALMPEREGKMYFMPLDDSALNTFDNLTDEDYQNIGNIPTEVYELPDDAMVYDMEIINTIHDTLHYAQLETSKVRQKQYKKIIDDHIKRYLSTGVPYSQYRPGMFIYPEILVDPSKAKKIEGKGVAYDKKTDGIKLTDRKA